MRVAPDALVISFVKYKGDPRQQVPADAEHNVAQPGAVRLACFHHYDEISLQTSSGNVGDAASLLATPSPKLTIAAKKALCFLVDGERTDGFGIADLGRVTEIALLRLSTFAPRPTLAAESIASEYIAANAGDELSWMVARTLAKRELLLLLSHPNSYGPCEEFLASLRRLSLVPGSDLPAFELITQWPCLRFSEEAQGVYDLAPQDVPDEEFTGVRGLRIVGTCERSAGERHRCADALNERIHQGLLGATPEKQMRPLAGVGNDRQVGWSGDARGLLPEIQAARTFCPSSCCSFYLVRETAALDPDRSLFAAGDVEQTPRSRPFPDGAFASLADIKNTAGCKLIGEQLETVRNEAIQALSNPFIAAEFEDLVPVLSRFATIARGYGFIRHPDQAGLEESTKFEVWAHYRGYADRFARYLGRAIDERVREDVCGQNHHIQSALLGASGTSRVSSAGTHALRKTLALFGLPWDGLCVCGVVPAYRSDVYMELFNSPVQATLEPYWHYGLGHEAGHSLWETKILGGRTHSYSTDRPNEDAVLPARALVPLNARTRKELGEYFSDAFCLKYTFDLDIEQYVWAWAHYYVEFLENESLREFLASIAGETLAIGTHPIPSGSSDSEGASGTDVRPTQADVYCERLLMATAYWLAETEADADNDSVAAEAVDRVIRNVRLALESRSPESEAARAVDAALVLFTQAIQVSPDDADHPLRATRRFLSRLRGAARRVKMLVDRVPPICNLDDHDQGTATALEAMSDGQVVLQPTGLPLSLLRSLGPNASFQACMATGLSLTHWAELEYNQQLAERVKSEEGD